MSDWQGIMREFWESLISLWWLKAAFGICASAFFSLLDMSHPSTRWVGLLLLIDFFLGVWQAGKSTGITPRGLCKGVFKFVGYACVFIILGVADRIVPGETLGVTLTAAFCFVATLKETRSCLKHVEFLFPGVVPAWIMRRLEGVERAVETGKIFKPVEAAAPQEDKDA